ncbi:hypothetical protein Ga0609869_003361 [Rhodovulum iodosum]|uniref:SPOR domain-containing protein n=1 Tax=Rhodovulum iodosum TaxID=68291 RepID=A0ABV3XXA2_9RHOB|nr:SPOR domain-containing protein [Rhodovulum robiginosum]
MLIVKFAVAATAAWLVMAPMGAAETLRQNDGPAEFPPPDFQGRQYIDSEGCVYLRAGYAGQVTWVPRVSRGRKVLCGFKPTFAKAQPAPTPAPATTAPRRAKAPGAPLPTVAQTAAPPKVDAARPSRAAAKPAPETTRKVANTPPPSPRPYRATQGDPSTVCPNAGAFSRRYINDGTRYPVRCGPQAAAPSAAAPVPAPKVQARPKGQARAQQAATAPRTAAAAKPAPRVAVQRPAQVAIPKGYKPLWTDDRLNPNRGRGTAAGKAAMDLVWTQTVPRRLIDTSTGRDVTGRYAHLEYPYTDYAQQKAHLATKGRAAPEPAGTRVSTKGRSPASARPASHRYVQVGAFGDPANARAAIARLQAMGLPVSAGTAHSKGKALKVIYAGPFQRQDRLVSAHAKLRRSGYPGAILRR